MCNILSVQTVVPRIFKRTSVISCSISDIRRYYFFCAHKSPHSQGSFLRIPAIQWAKNSAINNLLNTSSEYFSKNPVVEANSMESLNCTFFQILLQTLYFSFPTLVQFLPSHFFRRLTLPMHFFQKCQRKCTPIISNLFCSLILKVFCDAVSEHA